MSTLSRCFNIEDVRRVAATRLPAPVWGYLDGAAEDHRALHRNRAAFGEARLVPQLLNDVTTVDTSTTLLGAPSAAPYFLAPTGFTRLFHRDGEAPVARAATRAGLPYTLSTLGSSKIATLGAAGTSPFFFQIYVFRDEGANAAIIADAKAAGVDALILTIDVPTPGNRETDLRTGLSFPPRPTLRTLAQMLMKPGWLAGYVAGGPAKVANFEAHGRGPLDMASVIKLLTPAVTWDDAARMVAAWDGPFAIKGVHSPLDARRAADIGASAVIVSNHGGRQLDSAPAAFEILPEIVEAVGDRVEIIIDGGVRRGGDVIKAVAAGARGCAIGRPYLYGLVADGEAGVTRVIDILTSEIERDLALMGCASIHEVTAEHLRLGARLQRPAPAAATTRTRATPVGVD